MFVEHGEKIIYHFPTSDGTDNAKAARAFSDEQVVDLLARALKNTAAAFKAVEETADQLFIEDLVIAAFNVAVKLGGDMVKLDDGLAIVKGGMN